MSTSLPRRTFLRHAALAALAPAGCATVARHPAGWGYIDGHVHVWTADTQRYPLAPGFSVAHDMKPPSFTPEDILAQCRPQGVNRVLLIQMSFYRFDNRYMLHAIAQHPSVFRGIGIVDENQPDVVETMKALQAQGVRGFRLYADRLQAEAWSHSPGMRKMWAYAADAGLAMCPLAEPESLPAVRRMCQDFPRTTVVLDHFARIGMKHPARQAEVDHLRRLADFPQTHVKISAFYALGAKKPPYLDLATRIRQLRDTYSASRLLWGSDCPFQLDDGQTYADSISLIRDGLDFLTPEDKNWMLRGTAEKLFFS